MINTLRMALQRHYGRSWLDQWWPPSFEPLIGLVGSGRQFTWHGDFTGDIGGQWSKMWLGLRQPKHLSETLPWIAIDWDNPRASRLVSQNIKHYTERTVIACRNQHVPVFSWPSKSGGRHVFLYLPDTAWRHQCDFAEGLLSHVLGFPVHLDTPSPHYPRVGLNKSGHFLFPSPDAGPISMGLTAMNRLHQFMSTARDMRFYS